MRLITPTSRWWSVLWLGWLAISFSSWGEERLTFGRFNSRALFQRSDDPQCRNPLVILVPGSGANGPEEEIPGTLTGDGKDHSIFSDFARGLRQGHVGTLAIGKPGVDFFSTWDRTKFFYDAALYQGIGWQDLIVNLRDAVELARTLPCVDPDHIVVLGHSEGTQVAIDFAHQYPQQVSALILVGFAGRSIGALLDWQFYRRTIDAWLAPDVDANHDGFISRNEVKGWPEFHWDWLPGQDKISFSEIEKAQRANSELQKQYRAASLAKIWAGVFGRPPLYSEAAQLPHPLFIFTGMLDVQTPPEEALAMQAECEARSKSNCEITLMQGLGHCMSPPKGPRRQKLLDATLGPVDQSFLDRLATTARRLTQGGLN